MGCSKQFDMPICGPNHHKPNIETASIVSGIDLSQSINLSEIKVMVVSVQPIHECDGQVLFERKSELHIRVVSEDGESEDELEITIIRKSQRAPLKDSFIING